MSCRTTVAKWAAVALAGAGFATWAGWFIYETSFVLPDDENQVRIKVTRGDSGTTNYQGGGSSRNACNWDIWLYMRDGWVNIWKQSHIRGASFNGTSYEWDAGGILVVGNSTYQGGAQCDLEITALAAFAGDTVIP